MDLVIIFQCISDLFAIRFVDCQKSHQAKSHVFRDPFWVFTFKKRRHPFSCKNADTKSFHCFGHNSTQKAPTEELLVRILTKFCVDSESAIKTCYFFACDVGFAATFIPYIGTKILYETCLGHNSTHKAPTEELLVRILTKFCVDSESDVKT